jgi:hypothetical protein
VLGLLVALFRAAFREGLIEWSFLPVMVSCGRVTDGGRTHHQPSMLHALDADEQIGQLLNLLRFAFHHDNFKTSVVVEVSMNGGNDFTVVLMLYVG